MAKWYDNTEIAKISITLDSEKAEYKTPTFGTSAKWEKVKSQKMKLGKYSIFEVEYFGSLNIIIRLSDSKEDFFGKPLKITELASFEVTSDKPFVGIIPSEKNWSTIVHDISLESDGVYKVITFKDKITISRKY